VRFLSRREISMEKNNEFAVLVGRAFLREVEAGNTESAIAFGRAFLLSLGMKGPDESEKTPCEHGHHGEHLASVSN
jgi:hypothetical protein